eukprot:1858581-Pyramimonas_sp.AAC.1
MMYQGCRGRAVLYFGNKNVLTLERLTANIAPTPGLTVQATNSLPASLAAKQQVRLNTDTVKVTVKTLISHLVTRKFNSPVRSLRTPYVRIEP